MRNLISYPIQKILFFGSSNHLIKRYCRGFRLTCNFPWYSSWIPIIGFIAGIWPLVVEIIGIRQLHELTTGKAVLAVLIPIIIAVVIAIVLAAILVSLMFGGMGPSNPYGRDY
jgi:hypothetical protein